MGVSGLGPRRHLETAGEEGPRPGVNTCNRQELQLAGAGAGAGEELSWLEAVDPTDRQTDRWADWMARLEPGGLPSRAGLSLGGSGGVVVEINPGLLEVN